MLRPLPIARIVFSVQAPLKVVIRAGTRFKMGSHIIRSILARSIQASLFDGPCFTIMHLRIPFRHSPHMKMLVLVWANETRRRGTVIVVHIVQLTKQEWEQSDT